MILSLEIAKVEPGAYEARMMDGTHMVTTPSVYSSIEEAIRQEASEVPPVVAQFMDVYYGGVCSGTMSCRELVANSNEVANRLVSVLAEMHNLAGH